MKKIFTKLSVSAVALIAAMEGLTRPIFAQQIVPIRNGAVPANLTDYNEAKTGVTFAFYLVFIYRSLLFIGGLLVIGYFIMGAFEWITAQGEAGKISAARNKMTGAVMGLVVLAMVLVIFAFIQQVLGIEILTFSSGPTAPTTIDDGIFGPQNGAAGGRL